MKKVAVLGSTGSIGTQTLDVVRANDDLEVVGLAAGSNVEMLEKQIREFHPGFKTKDFNYKFFMTPAAFKAQNLNFSKLEYEQYKGHVFFVDWISG